jgi:peptidoglycan/LPS O-acetylase OafA/YrhL
MAALFIPFIVPVVRLSETRFLSLTNILNINLWEMTRTRLDTIMAGAVAALYYNNHRFQSILQRLFKWQLQWFAVIVLFLYEPIFDHLFPPIALTCAGYSIEAISITLIVLWSIQHQTSFAGRLLNSRTLVHIGAISYSLYLWNSMFCMSLNRN